MLVNVRRETAAAVDAEDFAKARLAAHAATQDMTATRVCMCEKERSGRCGCTVGDQAECELVRRQYLGCQCDAGGVK